MEFAARMLLTGLVIGTTTAVIGTGRVTLALVASTTLCWSFVPILQLMTGMLLMRGSRSNRASALAGYFETDRYWSSWLLALAAVLLVAPDPGGIVMYLALTAVVPLILTARALMAFRCHVFGDSRAAARQLVLAHQAITILLVLAYATWAGALWPRVVRTLGQ